MTKNQNVISKKEVGDPSFFSAPVKSELLFVRSLIKLKSEHFHDKHKEIRGKGITLPKTSGACKVPNQGTINFDGKHGRRDTCFNPTNETMRELEVAENIKKKLPTDSVKSFSDVNFESTPGRAGSTVIISEEFLSKENIITDVPALDKRRLRFINNGGQNLFESISYKLCNTFVNGVAASNWAKISHG